MKEHLSLRHRIHAYKLESNIYVLLLLIASTAISVWTYAASPSGGFTSNLSLALATSLLASIFVLLSDTFVKYKTHENDIFLEGIEKLGISNLHFNKRQLLAQLMTDCDRDFWASGYRLILTASLTTEIETITQKRVRMKFLCTPPWEQAFRLVYGHEERVMDNYIKALDAVLRGAGDSLPSTCEVRFTSKPIFNDTYRIDRQLVTGPYMHNRDRVHNRITANDFFTYELHRQSQLHALVRDEFETLWEDAEIQLDWSQYKIVSQKIRMGDFNDEEKQRLVRDCCKAAKAETPAADPDAWSPKEQQDESG